MKDRLPSQTISLIRDSLRDLEILTAETSFIEATSGIYSVTVEDINNGVSTNGKGTTKELALASAYAEFMERLQNDALYNNPVFKSLSSKPHFFADEEYTDVQTLNPTERKLISEIIGGASEKVIQARDKISTVPAFHYNSGRIIRFPNRLHSVFMGSNGMCAGNTPEEAITQGLFEIFERNSIRAVYEKEATFPIFKDSLLESLGVLGMISKLRKHGIAIKVLDASLNGEFPVISVVAVDLENSHYKVGFGSDTHIKTAIERTITEIFQGLNIESFKESLQDTYLTKHHNERLELTKSYCTGTGRYRSEYINETRTTSTIPDCFKIHDEPNEAKLKLLLTHLKGRGLDIYIRNNTVFGFPAFNIHVSKLSNPYSATEEHIADILAYPEAAEILRRGKNASSDQQSLATEIFSRIIKSPEFKYSFSTDNSTKILFPHLSRVRRGSSDFDAYFSIARLAHSTGNYMLAFQSLQEYEKMVNVVNSSILSLYKQFFLLMHHLEDSTKVESILVDLFGPSAREEIQPLFDNDNALENTNYPDCPHCQTCSYKEHCNFETWKATHDRLTRKMIQPDQNLRKVLYSASQPRSA
ncbi:YcaO-like family protein [Pelagicoccus albus]|uniref:YcaO-like family protein n=1 Tax=Pelagicoccus albus TaxID=415222 RepID=A0A7X1B660_9BACT|nr:YcaO-like family protein [Pelagicoccus albus]MBC2606099.1 YcaO-like family protein [Pelagicoccus albus]